jgi:hypothetical protein
MAMCVLMGLCASVAMPLKPMKSQAQFIKVSLLAAIFCASIIFGNASLQ